MSLFHALAGRSQAEVLWPQRRSFVQAAALWSAMGGYSAALAQGRSNIIDLMGDVWLNGQRLLPGQSIQTGDEIETGPMSTLVFVLGNSSFLVRQNTRMVIDRGISLHVVSVLRLLTGAVASVFGKAAPRRIVTPTVTAGIRGTGIYTEVFPKEDFRSYFCNCYGTIDVTAGSERVVSRSDYHQSFWAEAVAKNGRRLLPARAINHTDEELEYLALLLGQRTHWQTHGRKGIKDGMGYMDDGPGRTHPANPTGY